MLTAFIYKKKREKTRKKHIDKMQIEAFRYIADANTKVLILGTMPGKDSLEASEYYGHKNNLFWDIMFRICYPDWKSDEVVSVEYKIKEELLIANQIGLWDVLKFCDRENLDRKKSSLDKHIRNQINNDFKSFFKTHSKIKAVFFNGKKAESFFEDFRSDPIISDNRTFKALPSTSPSNKINSFQILKEWMEIRNYINN